MKRPSPRVLTTLVAVALALVVLSIGLPHLQSAAPFAAPAARVDSAADSAATAPAPAWQVRADTLHEGETLSDVLVRGGIDPAAVPRILRAAPQIDPRRVAAGIGVFVRTPPGDSMPAEVVFQLAVDRLLHVQRSGDSTWTSTEERLPWRTDTLVAGGTIEDNLYQALDDSAASILPAPARAELAWSLADIYEYRVDMSRDLQPGDSFRVLFQRLVGPGGIVRIGDIIGVRFHLSGSEMDAVRFDDGAKRSDYFDQAGRSMRAAFLRAPLSFRRISSVFGLRKHPILGIVRRHEGTDYAANAGTPVRAIGDGVVVFAGRRGGYGNLIEIRHRNGFVSRYGHLRGFARGIRPGRSVQIGETIGYVGMTGLATGPHLHFEILVHGVQRDPRVALRSTGGPPIASEVRTRFDSVRTAVMARLDGGIS